MIADIETHNLEAHVSICQERYLGLAHRFDIIEQRMEKIEAMVVDIHSHIHALDRRTNNKWDRTQTAIIGGLVGLVTYLATRLFF
jgi:hypothetical protein